MKHIYNEKQLGEKETRRYMRQMVSAVDHLHRAGIIHRYRLLHNSPSPTNDIPSDHNILMR